jgi:hypothetical protein
VYGHTHYKTIVKTALGTRFRKNLGATRTLPVIVIKQLGQAVAQAKALVEGMSFWLPVPRT